MNLSSNWKLVILSMISISMVSCGSKKVESTETFSLNQFESYDEAAQGLSLSYSTPAGVGTLLSLKEGSSGIGACTWFLVDDNLAMTNSHCIPDNVKNNASLDCGKFLQGKFFDEREHKGVLAKCSKVIMSSDISGRVIENNDYALIELDESYPSISKFELSREGVQEDDKVIMHTMNHSFEGYGIYSRYLKHSCDIKSSDILAKIQSKSTSPVIGFEAPNSYYEKCNSVKGNSGSPVVASDGKLIGILHGALSKDSSSISDSNAKNNMTTNVGVITNFRCLKFSHADLDRGIPSECSVESSKETTSQRVDQMEKDLEKKLDEILKEIVSEQPGVFEYEVGKRSLNSSYIINYIPKCVRPRKLWPAEDEAQVREERSMLSKSHSLFAVVKSYKAKVLIELDYYGNLSWDMTSQIYSTKNYVLNNLKDMESEDTLNVTSEYDLYGSRYDIDLDMDICQDLE